MTEKKEEAKGMELGESRTLSFGVDVILVRGPLKLLSDAIAQKRFLEGVVVSVMYFERFGVDKLKEFLNSKSIPLEPLNIESLRLSRIMRMLEGFHIISHDIHSLMGEVVKERNEIVHKLRHPDAIDENKAKNTIEKAIECLKALGVT